LNYDFGVSAECFHKKPHRGDRMTSCESLTLLVAACGACAACDGLGFARNTADATTSFDVFYWLQVRNFDVPLFDPTPNGPDYIDILGLCLHAQLFRCSVRFRMTDRPGSRKHFDRSPLFEIPLMLARLNHIGGRSTNHPLASRRGISFVGSVTPNNN
jgi:hypothetical protein